MCSWERGIERVERPRDEGGRATPRETGSGAVFGAGSRRVALSGVGAAVIKAEQMAHVTRQEVNGGVGAALYSHSRAGKGCRSESMRWHVVPRAEGMLRSWSSWLWLWMWLQMSSLGSRREDGTAGSGGSPKATPCPYSMVSLQLWWAWGLWFGDISATHAGLSNGGLRMARKTGLMTQQMPPPVLSP